MDPVKLIEPFSPKKIHYFDISSYKNELAEELRVPTRIPLREPLITKYVELLPLFGGMSELVIKPGFPWDGASGPTWDTKSSVRGSCVHDAFYYLERRGLLDANRWRVVADEMIRDICIEDGMWAWRAEIWYKVLRTFAASAAKANAKDEAFEHVLEAP